LSNEMVSHLADHPDALGMIGSGRPDQRLPRCSQHAFIARLLLSEEQPLTDRERPFTSPGSLPRAPLPPRATEPAGSQTDFLTSTARGAGAAATSTATQRASSRRTSHF
jgi:hypothetical protein